MFPSPQFRQCISDLKRGPIDKFIRSLPYQVIVNCIRIRAEESNPRARLSALTLNNALSTRKRTVYNWLPSWTEAFPTSSIGTGRTPSHCIRCICRSTTRMEQLADI